MLRCLTESEGSHIVSNHEGNCCIWQVQYPGLQEQFETDIATMALLSKAVAWVTSNLICSIEAILLEWR